MEVSVPVPSSGEVTVGKVGDIGKWHGSVREGRCSLDCTCQPSVSVGRKLPSP